MQSADMDSPYGTYWPDGEPEKVLSECYGLLAWLAKKMPGPIEMLNLMDDAETHANKNIEGSE
jgi:hypothetical protein